MSLLESSVSSDKHDSMAERARLFDVEQVQVQG